MQIVKVRLPAADLSHEMAEMREWLDSNGYEPTRFKYDQDGVEVVVSVDFTLDDAAGRSRAALSLNMGRGDQHHPPETARASPRHRPRPRSASARSCNRVCRG